MRTRAERWSRGTVGGLLLVALASGACGSGSSPTVGAQLGTTSSPTTATPTTPSTPVPTLSLPSQAATSVPFVAGAGTLTVTGDVQATARFSSASCSSLSVTEARGVVATFSYVSDPGTGGSRAYELDLAGLSPGRTTFPVPGGASQQPPLQVQLTTTSAGPADTLAWGTTAAGEGSVSGTVSTATANAHTGTFDLQLAFVGTGTHGPVHVSGGWTCP